MAVLERDDREIHYRLADRGATGPTCVFVHGSGADRRVWKAQDRLASEVPVVAIDLAGHGRSEDIDTDPGLATLTTYARDVAAVATDIEAEVLVGNSLGGAIVQWVLLEDLFDPTAAVLVGSGAKLAVREDLRGWLQHDFDRAIAFLHADDRLFHDPSPALVDASKDAMRACGQTVTARDYLTCHHFDVRDRLDELAVPTLALTGEHDQLTPPRYHEYLAEHLPAGRWTTIAKAAHLSMLERPRSVNESILEFIEAVA